MSGSFPSNANELMLYNVLQHANLLQYYDAFISHGGDDVNQLCEAGEDEFLEMMALVGMASKPLHVRRLQKALLEWILHPAMFSKPVQDRRPLSSSSVSKGSIYAAVQQQQQQQQQQQMPHNTPISSHQAANGIDRSSVYRAAVESRNNQPPRHYTGTHASLNNPATPNSDDCSDPDGSNASFGTNSVKGHSASPLPVSNLPDEHLSLIASVAEELAQTLPAYAPKPLNMKKPADKELQEVINQLDDDQAQIDLLRKYSVVCGRGDLKRKTDRQTNSHELCVNEAAAQLCRYRPSLLTRREDLLTLALQVIKETGLQFSKEAAAQSNSVEPPLKIPRVKSPTAGVLAVSPKGKMAQASLTSFDDEMGTQEKDASGDGSAHAGDSASLVDEGLRIVRQYGLGTEIEEELRAMKSDRHQELDDELADDLQQST